ncbi:MAG: hypothetical protein ABMB14_35360, partial [Myxococcota bacterium]
WGLWAEVSEGSVGRWTGEVRGGALRVWAAPTDDGAREIVMVDTPVDLAPDGAIVAATVTGLGPPDPYGERVDADGTIVDDRFVPLDDLPVDPLVAAVAREADGVHLAPTHPPAH